MLIRITNARGEPFAEVARDGEMDSLDEFVASGADVHIERMDDDHVWIGITSDGRVWHVHLHATVDAKGCTILAARVSKDS